MENPEQSTWYAIIKEASETFFTLVNELIHLASLESKLAVKSLVKIVALSFIVATLLTSTWLCILALLFVLIIAMHLSSSFALCIITLLNVLLLVMVSILIIRAKDKLFFPATRRQLRFASKVNEESANEQPGMENQAT